MKKLASLLLLLFVAVPAWGQAYGPLGAQTPVWSTTPTVGIPGNAVTSEVFTDTQGADPPALAYEPANIDESTNYTRSAWLTSFDITRLDQGEAKFRTNCMLAKFGVFDPIVGLGQSTFGHHHTFFGNKGINASSTYTSMRNSPASTCAGGPLNATAYWEPSLLYEVRTNVWVPVKPNIATFYYTLGSYNGTTKRIRFLNDFAFIGGVNPADPTNAARLAEINTSLFDARATSPANYDGWYGWQCFNSSNVAQTATGPGVYSAVGTTYSRFLVNPDGSDPWSGVCEGPNYKLIANITAPSCWDGKNLRSPTGRGHVRYPLYLKDDGNAEDAVCPDHWYVVMHFEVKTEFPAYTFAMRQKMHLSSDEMNPATGLMTTNRTLWQTPGSTMHFDWMGAWDSVVRDTWLRQCDGITINGTTASDFPNGRTCGNSTIDATNRMFVNEASPNSALSNNPVITLLDLGANGTASKSRFGTILSGSANVTATMTHPHH